MSELINIPRERFEELAAAPLQLAQMEAARMAQAGDVTGANRRIAEGVAQSTAIRAQIASQQQSSPAPAVQPSNPAAPSAPEVPGFVANPRTMGEEMMARAWTTAQQRKTAADAGAAMTDLRMPMGLRPRR